jgi:hypothetical protein
VAWLQATVEMMSNSTLPLDFIHKTSLAISRTEVAKLNTNYRNGHNEEIKKTIRNQSPAFSFQGTKSLSTGGGKEQNGG